MIRTLQAYWVSVVAIGALAVTGAVVVTSQPGTYTGPSLAAAAAAEKRKLAAIEAQGEKAAASRLQADAAFQRTAAQQIARQAQQDQQMAAHAGEGPFKSTARIVAPASTSTMQAQSASQQPNSASSSQPTSTSTTQAQSASQQLNSANSSQSADPYANCVDKGTCPLTIDRARAAAHEYVAKVAAGTSGASIGISGCAQQSPWQVACDYWINSPLGVANATCHYVASVYVIQPTYQRQLQFVNGVSLGCQ